MNTERDTFPSADRESTISARWWRPDDGRTEAVMVLTHGMQEYIDRYIPFAQFLTENGFAVTGHDHIGHGDSVQDPSQWGIMHCADPSGVMIADLLTNFQRAREAYPDLPVFILGHSMGSYMLRKFLSVYADALDGLSGAIVMGTGQVPKSTVDLARGIIRLIALFRGWDYRSHFVSGLMFGAPYQKFDLTGADPSNSWLTKDCEIVKKYYADPKCTYLFSLKAYDGLVSACGFDADPANVARIPKGLPVLFASGAEDPVGDAGAGVRLACESFRAAGMTDVSLMLFEGDRHEILNETDRNMVFQKLLGWMRERIASEEAAEEN